MAFPDNLQRIRLEQFLSQAELARRSGVHPLTVTRLENGKTAPSTRTVRAWLRRSASSPVTLRHQRKSPKPTDSRAAARARPPRLSVDSLQSDRRARHVSDMKIYSCFDVDEMLVSR